MNRKHPHIAECRQLVHVGDAWQHLFCASVALCVRFVFNAVDRVLIQRNSKGFYLLFMALSKSATRNNSLVILIICLVMR